MFALMGEVNLWTFDDNVNIKDTDFGAFKYHDKRIDGIYKEGKRSYCQKRGMTYVPVNRKGNKLKDSIKYLEDQLRDNSTIYCQWCDDCIAQLMLSNGLLVHIQVNASTGDIQKLSFDKYLVGKLSEHVSDVIITKSHLVCTYNDNQVTFVYFTKSKRHIFDKINKLEPKLVTMDLFGPNGRRLDKKVQVNKSADLVLIWWKSTMNEVYPWSPTMKEYDRANIHLYRLTGTKLELLCYIRTEFDPLCIMFDACDDNIIHSVEQKVSRKGEVTVEWRTYEVSQQNKLQRIAVISVPLPTHTSCVRFSPNQELLLLCCIDGTIMMYDQTKSTTTSVKAVFIPTLASWHSDGIIFAVGNDRGQFQHFDISLTCIKSQTLSDEATPANILDLSPYFRNQPALIRMEWNKKNDPSCYIGFYNHGNSLFLLLFERGPIGVIKIIEGDNLSGDELVRRYLSESHVEQATALLLSMNWDTYPRACMHALNQILNYLFKLPLTSVREGLIQNALGSFHIPVKPISQATEEEYGDEVRDLTRRFFHHLLRYRMFEKAFRLAIDLNDHDLFMDIHFYALVVNDTELATAAKEKAESILSRSNSCNSSHSTCSRASCSLCSDSSNEKREDEEETYSEESEDSPKGERVNLKQSKKRDYRKSSDTQIPPLPIVHPHHNIKNTLSSSYNNITSCNKTEYNLVSPSSSRILTSAFNHSSHIPLPNTFLASTSFNKPLYKTHSNFTPVNIANVINNSSAFNNASDDLMTTSFGSLSLTESEVMANDQPTDNFGEMPTYNKSLLNEIPYSFNGSTTNVITTCAQDDSFISTPFNKSVYESEDIHSNYLTSSLDAVDHNIMSTSFSSRISCTPVSHNNSFNALTTNDKPETTSVLRNTKASEISDALLSNTFTDALTTNKSSVLYSTCNSLMSTSFNFPENNAIPETSDTCTNTSNSSNDQAIKLPYPITEKKETDFDIPPPPSLTSSFTNYLYRLPKKNYSLSKSAPGLIDIDETVHKSTSNRMAHVSPRILQKQNSTSNIPQNQKISLSSRTYTYNYDLDYVSLHTTCDDTDTQCPQTTSRKLGSVQNFHSGYSLQHRLFENKYISKSSKNNANTNINKETKMSSNIPPLPVINTSTANSKICSTCPSFVDTPISSNEKPKVKFSDTVTHILVPGTSQAHKQKRPTTQVHITDPKRELAESLPLCLGNEDYLKDFQPLPKDDANERVKESPKSDDSTKIKVVHFGLL